MSNLATLSDNQIEDLVLKLMRRLVVRGVLSTFVDFKNDKYSKVFISVSFIYVDGVKLFNLSTSYMNVINKYHDLVYARVESFHDVIDGEVKISGGKSAVILHPENISGKVVVIDQFSDGLEDEQHAKPLCLYTHENTFIETKIADGAKPSYMYDYIINALSINMALERKLKTAFES